MIASPAWCPCKCTATAIAPLLLLTDSSEQDGGLLCLAKSKWPGTSFLTRRSWSTPTGRTLHDPQPLSNAILVLLVARMFAKFPDCLKVAFIDCAALLAVLNSSCGPSKHKPARVANLQSLRQSNGVHLRHRTRKHCAERFAPQPRMTRASLQSQTLSIRSRSDATIVVSSMPPAKTCLQD